MHTPMAGSKTQTAPAARVGLTQTSHGLGCAGGGGEGEGGVGGDGGAGGGEGGGGGHDATLIWPAAFGQ